MPAKQVKTLARNPKERKHRHHRSKKGQNPRGQWGINGRLTQRDIKRRKAKLLKGEMEKEINSLI